MSQTVMLAILTIASFALGWSMGSWYQRVIYGMLEWTCLRWSEDNFAYRVVPEGYTLHRGEKILMALPLPTDDFPDEGMPYGDSGS